MSKHRSPSDYIRQLQAAAVPDSHEQEMGVPPTVIELHGGDLAAAKKAVREACSRDYAQFLLKGLLPRLPAGFRQLLEGDVIAVGTIQNPEPNAHHEKLGKLSYAITINKGLVVFIYRVIRALSTRTFRQGVEVKESVTFDETCQLVTDIFFWFKETGQAGGPDYPITQDQVHLASTLAMEAERFFLAHEIGHAIWDFNRSDGEVLNLLHGKAWDEELFADKCAVGILLGVYGTPVQQPRAAIAYAGAELSLGIFNALESLGVEFQGTHPPFDLRIRELRANVRNACKTEAAFNSLASLARPFAAVMTNVTQRIAEPDWDAFLERAATDVMKQLDQLLDRCSRAAVPDYFSFYMGVDQLFNRGFSHRFLRHLEQVAHEFFSHLRDVDRGAAVTRGGN